jgi:hypothetical protein
MESASGLRMTTRMRLPPPTSQRFEPAQGPPIFAVRGAQQTTR